MEISTRWLNRYLTSNNGTPISGEVAERKLMALGFPSESRTVRMTCEGQDEVLDVEVTSNRGDCLCHVGAAREIGACSDDLYTFTPPRQDSPPECGESVEGVLGLSNTVDDACPLFTARVVRGVRVGPSPAWMVALLEGAGQRSVNNVVDVTNFLALELGNPCHAFDLRKLSGRKLLVRGAHKGETLTTLDGKARTLHPDDIVVADGARAQSLAGVMGGRDSEVDDTTTDVVLEVATWDPVRVRRSARRHHLRTTASHRFERIVDARTLEAASLRGASLLCELAGGRVCKGVLRAGRPLQNELMVRLRPARCNLLLGYELSVEVMVRHLRAVGVEVGPLGRGGDGLLCTIPPHRPDLTREVDLIEEIARVQGLDAVPVRDTIRVRAGAPQREVSARRELDSVLTGLGFSETVTFSFCSPARAKAWVPEGFEMLRVDDERRGDEPVLRPSVILGLLGCRRQNQHAGVRREGGVRLYEVASAYAQRAGGVRESVERVNLGVLMDIPFGGKSATHAETQSGLSMMRGVVESVVRRMAGAGADLRIEPSAAHVPALRAGSCARVVLGDRVLGRMGIIDRATQSAHELHGPVACAELDVELLTSLYPPRSEVVIPPAFPAIERDLSLIVPEEVRWEQIATLVRRHAPPPCEGVSFVGVYRGAQAGAGRKSVTLRLAFRDATRTLRHEEVDGPVSVLLGRMRGELAFEMRA